MSTITLSDLTPEQRRQLVNEAKQAEKKAKEVTQENRKAYKQLVDEAVPKFFDTLITQSQALSRTKLELFQGLKDLIELKKEAYGVKEGQQSHTLTSDNTKQTIQIGYRVTDGWDDTVHVGIDKVNEFISSLVKDEDTKKLVKNLNRLLKKDANGNLKSNRVMEIQKMTEDYDSDLLDDGLDIIRKAWAPVKSCYFIDAHYVDGVGKKQNVPLSVTSVDFPQGSPEIKFI